MTILDKLLFFMPAKIISMVNYLGANFHFLNIAKGIIDSRDIFYFISVIFISIFSTYLVMHEKN